MIIVCLPYHWRTRDHDGGEPHDKYHDGRESLGTSPPGVVERLSDGEVSVDADGTQTQDGCCGDTDVTRHPHYAHHAAQDPLTYWRGRTPGESNLV